MNRLGRHRFESTNFKFILHRTYIIINFRYFLQMAMASNINCDDRTCEVEYRLLPNCVIYVDNDQDTTCQYPCSFLNCKTEMHPYTVCPIWTCSEKTTTTPSPPLSTLVPFPSSSSSGLITSIILNVLFGIALLALVGLYLLHRRRNQRLTAFMHSATNPSFESGFELFTNERPIIRNQEREPLIPRTPPRRNSNPRPQIHTAALPNFYAGPEAAVLPISTVQETSF